MHEHLRIPRSPEDFAGAGDPGAIEACFAYLTGETPGGPRVTKGGRPSLTPTAERALTQAYRDRGFLKARLDPLALARLPKVPELDATAYGLEPRAAAGLIAGLEAAYCGTIGWEFAHIHDAARRRWIEDRAESGEPRVPTDAERAHILTLLARAYTFDTTLAQVLPGAKLFGLGGAESFIVLLETVLAESARLGVEEVVVGGMHRGRFNMLANVMGKPLAALLAEIQGAPAVPEGLSVSSDAAYHLGFSGECEIAGRRLRVSVSPHPSHLQLAPIISQGRARAKQAMRGSDSRRAVLPLLLHTDASFAGQGHVAEMFQLSRLAPFELGGSIHVVINNQIGFTTPPEEGRSARHPTDIAKLVEAPVLHVNGDDPEAVYRVALVTASWRAAFGSDIVVDLVCYRRPGHNEIDQPRSTQPRMYRAIDARTLVHQLYEAELARRGLETSQAARAAAVMTHDIRSALKAARSYVVNRADWFKGAWAGFRAANEAEMLASPDTGLPLEEVRRLGAALSAAPPEFTLEPKVARFLAERRRTFETGQGINWASGEALALASLLAEGTPVRLGGQDTVRGAFTQRHLELHDQKTGARHLVLASAARDGVAPEIHNTPLIEHAVLCFEYGLSLADPRRLVIWEAQFGDFLNIAQPVFDQCIACGEDRWLRSSGLVIQLPHGLDGGGPDHATGRPERLLAASAGANIIVANVSTPANFFHLLRRQMHWPFRKPLVVLTPKALLRHKRCVSGLDEFGPGTGFRTVIADDAVRSARRVVLCTGKIYYELDQARGERGLEKEIALVRLEQLHPFPAAALRSALEAHAGAEIVWCEEEPENMGYFTHLDRKLERVAGRPVRRAGRPAAATPAVGVKVWLQAEAAALIGDALG
jgi:2-oxoglutarate dehydrogenase E1 component